MLITFHPSKQTLRYKVTFNSFNKNSKASHNTFTYSCEVKRKKETLSGSVVNFKRYDTLLNNTKIHEPMNEIALISGELLNDLDLEITRYGEILKIKNLKAIQERWKTIKYKIEYTYLGDIVKKMVNDMESNILDEKRFIKSLSNDPFFHNFLSIYKDYPDNCCSFQSELSYIAGIGILPVNIAYVIEEQDRNKIIKGKASLLEETKQRLLEQKNIQEIELSLNTTHQITSGKYLNQLEMEQELRIDGELFATKTMNILHAENERI